MIDRSLKVKAIIDRNIRDIILLNGNSKIGFVSVNKIEITNDYSLAKVYVSFMNAENREESFQRLVRMAPHFRHELAQKLSLYKTPNIRFVLDDRFIIDEKMNELLKKDSVNLKKIKKK